MIRSVRCFLDWTRADLAKASGISEATIKNVETGKFQPNAATLEKLVWAFNARRLVFVEGGVRRVPKCEMCGHPADYSQHQRGDHAATASGEVHQQV
ncbi:MAG: helix-turn-helix transcriptional regulator [Acetobacteraceae bacterium]